LRAVEEEALSEHAAVDIFLETVNAIAFTPDGTRIAAAGSASITEGAVWILSVWRHLEVVEKLILPNCANGVLDVAWSAEGLLAACGCDSRVTVWNKNCVEVFCSNEHADWLAAVAFAPDGRLAVAGFDDRVSVYNFYVREKREYRPPPQAAAAEDVAAVDSSMWQGLGIQVRSARGQMLGFVVGSVAEALGTLGLDEQFRSSVMDKSLSAENLLLASIRNCLVLSTPGVGRLLRSVLAPGGSLAVLQAIRTSVHGLKRVQVQQKGTDGQMVTATLEFPPQQRSFTHFVAMLLAAADIEDP
jgi:hypothetical protein